MGLIFGRSTIAKDTWNKAKKAFEAKTGKKKPSKKFLGAFRKSSGLESAIDDVDQLSLKVWDAATQKDFDKAKANFDKGIKKLKAATADYVKVLETSAEGDYAEFKEDVIALKNELLKQVTYLETKWSNRNGFK
jgi:hypothetical protein